jgi:hypothetical protein
LSQNPEEAPPIENGNDLATVGTKDEEEPEHETLDHRDLPALRKARAELEVRHKKKSLDLFFRVRVTNMIALINLFIDPDLDYGWMQCSELAAKAAGKGSVNHARNLRKWVVAYMRHGELPLNRYGRFNTSILADEDLAQQIHLHLTGIAKDGYVRAQDVVDVMATPEMKRYLGTKSGITKWTGRRWLHAMEWRYGKATKGMYIDGHERGDVVEYRKGFLARMTEYSKLMTTYDRDGNVLAHPTGVDLATGILPLVEITQDESTFTMYDRRRTKWDHADAKQPEEKNEGPSLMISGMLTQEWGELEHNGV